MPAGAALLGQDIGNIQHCIKVNHRIGDPLGQPTITADSEDVFTHVLRTSIPTFQNLAKKKQISSENHVKFVHS